MHGGTHAQYVMPDGLRWNHNRDLIFDAGNEYHKFEILSTKVASMGIDSLSWDGQQFHAFPFINEPRPNYIYDEDANGAFLLRNSDNTETRYTSDYMMVHFRLKTTPSSDTAPSANNQQSSIYVNGDWTYDSFLPKYRMTYNPERKQYETTIPLKLGYYSYQYLQVDNDGTVAPCPQKATTIKPKTPIRHSSTTASKEDALTSSLLAKMSQHADVLSAFYYFFN